MRLRSNGKTRRIWFARHSGKDREYGRKIHDCQRQRPRGLNFYCPANRDHASVTARMKSTEPKIRVLIADDHTTVLAGLASIIGMQPDMVVVAEAANGRQSVDLWRKHRPDVTLLDLRMPMLDRAGVIDEIRKEHTSARIIILTTYDNDNDIYP